MREIKTRDNKNDVAEHWSNTNQTVMRKNDKIQNKTKKLQKTAREKYIFFLFKPQRKLFVSSMVTLPSISCETLKQKKTIPDIR